MRLFVAAEIGEALAGHAVDFIVELRRRAVDLAPAARITWLTGARLHLTITFIGEVADRQGEAIAAALASSVDVAPFAVYLEGTGAFPAQGAPRVVWAGVAQGAAELKAIEREIAGRLAPLGIRQERRPYRPHLTLARIRDAAGLRIARLLEGLEQHRLGATHIDAITLFQSRLSPKGPSYVPLMRTLLRAG